MVGTTEYQIYLDSLKSRCIDYPAIVSIETYAYCNAACNFCPYPNLTRKMGQDARRLGRETDLRS